MVSTTFANVHDLYSDDELYPEHPSARQYCAATCGTRGMVGDELRECGNCHAALCVEHRIQSGDYAYCSRCLAQAIRADIGTTLESLQHAPDVFTACQALLRDALKAVPRG